MRCLQGWALIAGLACASAACVSAAFAEDAKPQPDVEAAPAGRRVVKLKIAARDETIISHSRVAELIDGMNALTQQANANCRNLSFLLTGDVVYNDQLAVIGDDTDLEKSLKSISPASNIFVVSQISSCGGVFAAGCTNVGVGPMVVIDEGGQRANVVWVHERGHASGLGHIAQGVSQDQVSAADAANIMYWMALGDATTLNDHQCSAYLSHAVAATTTTAEAAPAVAAAPVASPNGDKLSQSVAAGALTPAARNFFFGVGRDAPSWAAQPPVDAMKKLTPQDVASIENAILSTKPIPQWDHMIFVLGYLHSPHFMNVATTVLNLSAPQIPELTPVSRDDERIARDALLAQKGSLDKAKAIVPTALGLYGFGADDPSAAFLLASFTKKGVATAVFGKGFDDFIAKTAAPRALGIAAANSDERSLSNVGAAAQLSAKTVVGSEHVIFDGAQFEFKPGGVREQAIAAAPAIPAELSADSVGQLNDTFHAVRHSGLDKFLAPLSP